MRNAMELSFCRKCGRFRNPRFEQWEGADSKCRNVRVTPLGVKEDE
jgi:hypothetical protein